MSYEYAEDRPDEPHASDARLQAMAEQPRDPRDPDYDASFWARARVRAAS